jgi:Na+-driven multidrug efflux pump
MALIIRISAPRALQSVSMVGFVVFLSLVGRIGLQELAISNIIYKAFNFSFMIGLGVGTASATLVGRSLGEGNGPLAVRYGWHSVGIGSILMGVIGMAFMFFPREIMGIFSDQAGTIEKGVFPFRLLGAFKLLDGVGIILSRTLQGVGSTVYVMVSEMICIWGLLIPYTYLAVEFLDGDIVTAWWGLFIYIIAFTAAMAWKFHEGGWKHVRI